MHIIRLSFILMSSPALYYGYCGTQMPRLCFGSYSQADDTTLVEVLYESQNFIVVNKRFDLKVNSDDDEEVTVASILRRLYPSSVDEHASHGFRSANKIITSSIARSAKRRYLSYSEGNFEVFHLQGQYVIPLWVNDKGIGPQKTENFAKILLNFEYKCLQFSQHFQSL